MRSIEALSRFLAKRREIITKAALDYHAGRISLADYLRCLVTMRR